MDDIKDYLNSDGSFKYTKLGNTSEDVEKACNLLINWARERYTTPYLKSILPLLEKEICACKITGKISPNILLSIAMPPMGKVFKFDDITKKQNIQFDLPRKFFNGENSG